MTLASNEHFDIGELERIAKLMRATCIEMAHHGKEGHLSSALSCIDILVALYHSWLRYSPEPQVDDARDRLIFSKGHAATALYAVMAERGLIPVSQLKEYARTDGALPNHPCKHALPILEMSTGSLGHGLGVATGMLYGFSLLGHTERRAVVVMSDGECNEGSVWESAMFAAAHKMDQLLAIIDNNNQQAVGRTDELTGHTSFADKFKAFGWAVRSVDGNDLTELVAALQDVPFNPGMPSAIIAKTMGGAGVSFMEDQIVWHYRCPSQEDMERALEELGVPAGLIAGVE